MFWKGIVMHDGAPVVSRSPDSWAGITAFDFLGASRCAASDLLPHFQHRPTSLIVATCFSSFGRTTQNQRSLMTSHLFGFRSGSTERSRTRRLDTVQLADVLDGLTGSLISNGDYSWQDFQVLQRMSARGVERFEFCFSAVADFF